MSSDGWWSQGGGGLCSDKGNKFVEIKARLL